MLLVSDLWARYGDGDWILRGLSLSLKDGEVGLIIGETGSGKTTLVRALTGVLSLMGGFSKGIIRVNDVNVDSLSPRDRSRLIGVVYQDPTIHFIYPRIDEDLELTASEYGLTANELIRIAGLSGNLRGKLVTELSMGQLQRLALAKVLIRGVKVIIMDEPLAHLDQEGINMFTSMIREIKGRGITLLMLEHRYENVINLADKVLQLSEGKLSELKVRPMGLTGRRYSIINATNGDYGAGNAWLRLINVWFRYDDSYVLKGINLSATLNRVIITGPNGSGKTTLLRLILGAIKPSRGSVIVNCPRPILYVPQDTKIITSMGSTIGELYLELTRAAGLMGNLRLLERELRNLEFNVDINEDPVNLSEGQRRLLMLVMARLIKPNLLVMDEPTSGLSNRYRVELANFINESNLRVVAATQDLYFASLINDSEVYYVRGWDGYVSRVRISEHEL